MQAKATESAVTPYVPLATAVGLPEAHCTGESQGLSWTLGDTSVCTKSG